MEEVSDVEESRKRNKTNTNNASKHAARDTKYQVLGVDKPVIAAVMTSAKLELQLSTRVHLNHSRRSMEDHQEVVRNLIQEEW